MTDPSASDVADQLRDLVSQFLGGHLSPSGFDGRYRETFQTLPLGLSPTTFSALERLFFACDDYVDEPSIRAAGDLDGDQLRAAAQAVATEVFGL